MFNQALPNRTGAHSRLGALVLVCLVVTLSVSIIARDFGAPALAAGLPKLPDNSTAVQPGGQCSFYAMDDAGVPFNAALFYSCALTGSPVRLSMSICDGTGAEDATIGASRAYSCRSHWYHVGAILNVPSLSTLNPDLLTSPTVDIHNNTTMGGTWQNTTAGVNTWNNNCTTGTPGPSSTGEIAADSWNRVFSRTAAAGGMLVRGMTRRQHGNWNCGPATARCAGGIGNGDDNLVQWGGCSTSGTGNDLPGGTLYNAVKRATDRVGAQNMRAWACYDVACSSRAEVHVATAIRADCASGCVGSAGVSIVPKPPTGTSTCNIDVQQLTTGGVDTNNGTTIDFSTAAFDATLRFACWAPASQATVRFDVMATDNLARPLTMGFSLRGEIVSTTGAPAGYQSVDLFTQIYQRVVTGGQWAYVTGEVDFLNASAMKVDITTCNGATTTYPRSNNFQTQPCQLHPAFDYGGTNLNAYGVGNANGAQQGGQAIRVETVTSTGVVPGAPSLAPGGSKTPVPKLGGLCEITKVTLSSGGASVVVPGHLDRETWVAPYNSFQKNVNYTVTIEFTGPVSRLEFFLEDVLPDERDTADGRSQSYFWSNPTSPAAAVVTALHDGSWPTRVVARTADGTCDSAQITKGDTIGQGVASAGSRLQKCVADAYGEGTESFDLLDPSTWVGAAVAALNPANFVSMSWCLIQATIVPAQPMSHWIDQVADEFNDSTVDKVIDAAATPFAAVEAFVDNANSGTCAGPEVQVQGTSLHPLESCGASAGVREVVYIALGVTAYLGGGLLIVGMIVAAFGLRVPIGQLSLPGSDKW